MAIFSTETEITTDVALDIEVTVQDQDGNNIERFIDCDIDGNNLELCAQINIQKIKEELEEEVRDELRQEIEDQFVADIAESVNPFTEIANLLNRVGNSYSLRQNRIKENTKLSVERNLIKSDVITGLKAENEVLQQTVVSLTEQVERLVQAAVDKAQGGPIERISKEHADQFGDV